MAQIWLEILIFRDKCLFLTLCALYKSAFFKLFFDHIAAALIAFLRDWLVV